MAWEDTEDQGREDEKNGRGSHEKREKWFWSEANDGKVKDAPYQSKLTQIL